VRIALSLSCDSCSRLADPGWLISQVDGISPAEQRLLGAQARGSAIGLALAERLHPIPSRHVDLSDRWSPELWASLESVRKGTTAVEVIASTFTPYAGRGRRVMTHLIELAAVASASADRLRARDGGPGRAEWRLPLVRDALTNAASSGFAAWSEIDVGSVRRPKLEGEPHLNGARLVVAFGLGECLAPPEPDEPDELRLVCGKSTDASVRRGRHARAPFYCSRHAAAGPEWRAKHRDSMHDALEHAARFYGVR